MSDLQDRIKQFMRGDYESFDEIQVEEKKKNLSACITAFKKKLTDALLAIDDAKAEAVKAMNEGFEPLNEIAAEAKSKKMEALVEGYKNTHTMLELVDGEEEIKQCADALNLISESIESILAEEGIAVDMDQPTVVEPIEEIGTVGTATEDIPADNPATEPMMEEFENVVFMQGDDAEEALGILDNQGEEAAAEHLKQWHYPGEHETREDLGQGTQDTVREFPEGDGTYYLVYNKPLGYIGLSFKEGGEQLDEGVLGTIAKKFGQAALPKIKQLAKEKGIPAVKELLSNPEKAKAVLGNVKQHAQNIKDVFKKDEEPSAAIAEEVVPPAAVTADSAEIKPEPLDEEPEHDAIPGVDVTTAGATQQPQPEVSSDPTDDPRDPQNQHEKPVEGSAVTSAYEEGFQRGRKLWEMGSNAKNIAQQLAETELSESPYGYVTRFQEGVIAGFAFQEEVEKDNNPDRFASLEEKSKKK